MISAPIPILRSFDEAKAKAFYLDYLGFDLVFEHRFDPAAPLYFAVRKETCEIHLSEHHGDATPGSALRIPMADVRGYCERLTAKPYANARPTCVDQPYGWCDMALTDPFGNRLIFCTDLGPTP